MGLAALLLLPAVFVASVLKRSAADASAALRALLNETRVAELERQQDAVSRAEQFCHAVQASLRTGSQLPPVSKPIGSAALRQLQIYADLLQSYADADASPNSDSAIQLVHRTRNVQARVQLFLGRLDRAATELTKAVDLSVLHPRAFRDPDSLLTSAIARSRLGWLLSQRGRWAEATEFTRQAVTQLSDLAGNSPPASRPHQELALALRNLGILQVVSGRDGTDAIRQSLLVTNQLMGFAGQAAEHSTDEGTCQAFIQFAEFHVDSCQILVALLWNAGRYDEAERVAQESVGLIRGLREFVPGLAVRIQVQFPESRYRIGQQLAEANLSLLTRESRAGGSGAQSGSFGSRIPGRWTWQPLAMAWGQAISADVLAAGRLHAEFEQQQGLLLSWIDQDWASEAATAIVVAAHRHVEIVLCVANERLEQSARAAMLQAGVDISRISFRRIDTGTFWVRDFGPVVIETGQDHFQILDTWYRSGTSTREDHVPRDVGSELGLPVIEGPVYLPQGALLTNGAGICLVSRDVLQLHQARGDSEAFVTQSINRITGAEKVVYLEPLIGEPTQHLDWFAAFVSVDTLVLGEYRNGDPANEALLARHAATLEGLSTPAGPLKVVRIPMPPRQRTWFGGTFTNVVFANGVLLVPTWSDESNALQAEAFATYERLLPDCVVVGVDCSRLGPWEGALRCATMNLFSIRREMPADLRTTGTLKLRGSVDSSEEHPPPAIDSE